MSAVSTFCLLQRPVAARHRHERLAAALPADVQWVERAVAACAASENLAPGTPIPPEQWRPHLSPAATPELRSRGLNPFSQAYGLQHADRPVAAVGLDLRAR